MRKQVTQCPVCDGPLRISELSCTQCETRLRGNFPPAPLARISADHQQFVETFVRCRGIIRDVERALGISYPTVRAKLDAAINALEAERAEDAPHEANREARRRALLYQVQEGLLDPAAAAEKLRLL